MYNSQSQFSNLVRVVAHVVAKIVPSVSCFGDSIRWSESGSLRDLSTPPHWLAVDFHVVLYTYRAAQISIFPSTTPMYCTTNYIDFEGKFIWKFLIITLLVAINK